MRHEQLGRVVRTRAQRELRPRRAGGRGYVMAVLDTRLERHRRQSHIQPAFHKVHCALQWVLHSSPVTSYSGLFYILQGSATLRVGLASKCGTFHALCFNYYTKVIRVSPVSSYSGVKRVLNSSLTASTSFHTPLQRITATTKLKAGPLPGPFAACPRGGLPFEQYAACNPSRASIQMYKTVFRKQTIAAQNVPFSVPRCGCLPIRYLPFRA